MGKNERIQQEANHLIEQLASGNMNLGKGSKNLFKDINYLRGDNGARVFFRQTKDGIEILEKASKANEQKVINLLHKLYDQFGGKNMKIKKISYPTSLEEISDIEDDNIDIFVELDDGMVYTMTVSTPKNYYKYMDREKIDYIPSMPPDIIVRKLTGENIRNALETYVKDDGYWFKLYYLAGSTTDAFDIKLMDKMIQEIKKQNEEIE